MKNAITQIGIKESPFGSNKTKYGAWYGMDGQPWCAMFCTWNYMTAGGNTLSFAKGSRYAYVPYVVQDARNNRNGLSITSNPVPGDMVCFDWGLDGTFDHIGLFEQVGRCFRCRVHGDRRQHERRQQLQRRRGHAQAAQQISQGNGLCQSCGVKRSTSDVIAVVLAAGLSLSVIALVVGVSVAAVKNGSTASTLSENETQVLTTAFSGMIGVLGAWVGYRAARGQPRDPEEPWPNLAPTKEQPTLPNWPDRKPYDQEKEDK